MYNVENIGGAFCMLFRKKITRSCLYCAHGAKIGDGDQVVCVKKGVVDADGGCHRFRYDPLKRTPPRRKAIDFSRYNEEDYSL